MSVEGIRVKLSKTWVPPSIRTMDGKVVHVDGYWRKGGKGRAVAGLQQRASDTPAVREKKSQDVSTGELGSVVHGKLPDGIVFADQRKEGAALQVDGPTIGKQLDAAGVNPGTKIKLRLRNAKHVGEQGLTQKIGDDEYRIVISVYPKEKYEDRHRYPINNSMIHEMRHVTQWQTGKMVAGFYTNDPAKYATCPSEIDSRYYGRLADATGEKDTGPAGKAQGKTLWSLT